jgi:hypothetical protein
VVITRFSFLLSPHLQRGCLWWIWYFISATSEPVVCVSFTRGALQCCISWIDQGSNSPLSISPLCTSSYICFHIDCLIVFRLVALISIDSGSNATCFSVHLKKDMLFWQIKKGLLALYLNVHHDQFAAWHAFFVLSHQGHVSFSQFNNQASSDCFQFFQQIQVLYQHFGHHRLVSCAFSCSMV